MENSFSKSRETFPAQRGNIVIALVANRFEQEARTVIPATIGHKSADIISFQTGARKRTVQGWQRGDHLPGPGYLFALSHMFPEIADLVERHRALTGAQHPALIKEAKDLGERIARYVAAHEGQVGT